MLRLVYTLVTILLQTATASAFGCRWMTHPVPDDSSHVWFRRTFTAPQQRAAALPRTAYISVASTGRFVLYVNGRNVSTALYAPERTEGDTTAVAITYDVKRFLRPDTNTIALLYCPSTTTRRQISVTYYGTAADNTPFATQGADGWLCRHADTRLTPEGGEAVNRGTYPFRWTDTDQPLALWLAAEEHTTAHADTLTDYGTTAEDICGYSPLHTNPLVDNAPHITSVQQPLYTERSKDTLTVHLAPARRHLVRVTLRGCRQGEQIRIGTLLYTCTGEMDEQAFARFTTTAENTITISGDRHFDTEQVQDIEDLQFNKT